MSIAHVPDDVIARQHRASDPGVSAWVSANAGSGKTYVLAQRVIRLLLEGTDPAKILCLTFTKAAAANMANRVFDILATWSSLDDTALDAELRRMTNRRPDEDLRRRARQIFAAALETPGGLKVQTIHAFCTRLLQQFPFEANVAARFSVLDDATETQILNEIMLDALLEGAGAPDSPLGRALATAVAVTSDTSFRDIVSEAIRKRDAVARWVSVAGGVDGAIAQLCGTLGIGADDTNESIERDITEGPLLPSSEWSSVAAVFRQGSSNDQKQAARLDAALKATGSARATEYLTVFVDSKGEMRKALATKVIEKTEPGLCERLIQERARLAALRDKRKGVACRDRTRALLTVADAVISRYAAEKARRSLLDYSDLIDKTVALLTRADAAAWVHYKLDLGIDHVLIDEAQDTSPRQWEIVTSLVAEFSAGAGARSVNRTIFAVGDDKQSIFSFQGADPRQFDAMRRHFQSALMQGEKAFDAVRFAYSFRSVSAVLDAVDAVFSREAAYRGLTADRTKTVHQAVRADAPGLVEIWPLIEPLEKPAQTPWDAPFDTETETTPRVVLASRVAAHVKHWIAGGEAVGDGDKRRRVSPRDILVLVRQRGTLFEAIIRALKHASVPVAGADRLVLTAHIAIMDLLALADALLLPADDLALACVLKSPLFGLSEDDLLTLAHDRPGTLRQSLAHHADGNTTFAEAERRLAHLAGLASTDTPFGFYARVLGAEGGRRAIHARLGHEAADALDEFLNLALDYERRQTPSLQGFVHWLRAANAEVKRDMELDRDEVRVMTVHGAKGLEAPIVILADTTTPPAGPTQHQPKLFHLPAAGAAPDAPLHLVWSPKKDDDLEPVISARTRVGGDAGDEYRRLLYVAMTRAADRLVVCGARGRTKIPDDCWYQLISDALSPLSAREPAELGEGEVLRFRKGEPSGPVTLKMADAASTPAEPSWLRRRAHSERADSARHVAPSRAHASSDGDDTARRRGTLVHRLLQSLPSVPHADRERTAHAHLARAARTLDEAERVQIVARVMAILQDPTFTHVFAPGSRAEVPIVGRVGARRVSGQVDRLTVSDDAVLVADFKSDRRVPAQVTDVPPGYVMQLALYRAVLSHLYPGRSIRAALVWTESATLMPLPDGVLEGVLI